MLTSSCTFAAISGAVISASPTRTASTFAAASRSTSSAVDIPEFGNHRYTSRDHRTQSFRCLQRCLKRAQVAIVDPDQADPAQFQRPRRLLLVVHLHQGSQAQLQGQAVQSGKARIVGQCRGDQQDRVRPIRSRFVDLRLVDNEILSQQRQRDFSVNRSAYRLSSLPRKNLSSVSTLIAAAPCSA